MGCQQAAKLLFRQYYDVMMTNFPGHQEKQTISADLDYPLAESNICDIQQTVLENSVVGLVEPSGGDLETSTKGVLQPAHIVPKFIIKEVPSQNSHKQIIVPIPEKNYSLETVPKNMLQGFQRFVTRASSRIPHVSLYCGKESELLRQIVQVMAATQTAWLEIIQPSSVVVWYDQEPVVMIQNLVPTFQGIEGSGRKLGPTCSFTDVLFWLLNRQGSMGKDARNAGSGKNTKKGEQQGAESGLEGFVYQSLLVFASLIQTTYQEMQKPADGHIFEVNLDHTSIIG